MRYIGSKTNLLHEIDKVVPRSMGNKQKFCDVFGGTGAVGRHFKRDFEIIGNDLLHFSYVLQVATIRINSKPRFTKFKREMGIDPFAWFRDLDAESYYFEREPFIYNNYSPNATCERMYFTPSNALRIDAIRQCLDSWKMSGLISDDEFYYLLAGLIEGVPSVSNIAGTYGAYLKHWDSRTSKVLTPVELPVLNNGFRNSCHNQSAEELVKKVSGDVLYMDPPYNGRQYLGNYHILETVSRYDYPEIGGKTGIRKDSEAVSDLCKKGKAAGALRKLVNEAQFELIILSYSTDGIVSEDELVGIFESECVKGSVNIEYIPYRRYARQIETSPKSQLFELLISGRK